MPTNVLNTEVGFVYLLWRHPRDPSKW